MQELVIVPLIGFVAGFVGTMLGIGGGAIMVPFLTLLGFDIKRVVPASLFAILGTSAGGLRYLLGRGLVDYRLAVILELASTTGALTGVAVFGKLSNKELIAILGFVLVLSGILFLVRQRVVARREKGPGGYTPISLRDKLGRLAAALSASFAAGMFSAMLGIGGGVIKVPILVLVLGLPIHVAVSTSKLMVGITALAGLLGHVATGNVDWLLAVLLLVGTYTGATVSSRVLVRLKARSLYIIAALYYFIMGAYLVIKSRL
ncbi:sulfite exporter TauE/SafE family protein [Pyrofollis japonicus]|uniref:sulfite exporter TauE/SafE family protein n=1 Tax=Pyrofollis japonicus TaxID=3060460 RepID=UPI00295B538F|nr:sulfite exporter TauE/SafE family protein [Pyrofollis japonicus]BEP18136.1 sulfite exporter TauE/SafE family protein [Pyrofollis japonicus]